MQAVSRNAVAAGIPDEHEQRLIECRRFLAEIGMRATGKCLQSWQSQLQPETAAMKKLMGVVALMAAGGTRPEETWTHVVNYVLVNSASSDRETHAAAGLRSTTAAAPVKRSRSMETQKDVAPEVDEWGWSVSEDEHDVAFSRVESSSLPAVEPFAAAVTSGATEPETSGTSSVLTPGTGGTAAPCAPVSIPAPYGAPSEPHRVLVAAELPPTDDPARALNQFSIFTYSMPVKSGK